MNRRWLPTRGSPLWPGGSSPWLVAPLVVVSWTSCSDCTPGRLAAALCWGGCVPGALFEGLWRAVLPFGSSSAPRNGARRPVSGITSAPGGSACDAGDAAEPLQLVDSLLFGGGGSPRTVCAEQKAHGSIGHGRSGNAGLVQRICTWRKTLRSSGCARRRCRCRLYMALERGLERGLERESMERTEVVERRRSDNGERGSPTVNGQDASFGDLE